MNETILYFDCFSGASGDMILGALVEVGVPLDALAVDLGGLPCGPIRLRTESVMRGGIRATKVHVESPHEAQPHRSLSEIRDIIGKASSLPERVRERAIRVFTRLAEVEASVHDVPVEEVHFHEIGALDAIADIVGAACGIERLRAPSVLFSTLRLGGGAVQTAHGNLPVPAPATAQLVSGFKCEMGPADFELLTPTAAAILTTLGEQRRPPCVRIEKVGYGAGDRDVSGHPNVLRAFLGRVVPEAEADSVWVVEANLDDATPELCGHVLDRLLAAGALDAYVLPIQMKKSRPAFLLCAIVGDEALGRVEETFFHETTTFGLRRHRVERAKLAREIIPIETPYGPIRVKVGRRDGKVITLSPEYEDCRRIAIEKDIPLRDIMNLARRVFLDQGNVTLET